MIYDDFSVAISVYKNEQADFLDRALESITDLQSIKPSEIVLVVDGPIGDDLNQVIAKYEGKYSFLKTIRLSQNGGLGNALRIAVENCSHELIARMDSDDISLPNRFEEQLKLFKENPNLDIVGADITEFIDTEDNIVAQRKVPTKDSEIKEYLKIRCPFNHVSVMYKKSAVIKAGGYLDLFWNEDYYLWIRMCELNCMMANTGTVLVNVRTGKNMYKRRGGIKYFQSEKYLQNYMLKRKIIGFSTYCVNLIKRVIVQVFIPPAIRGWVFRKFAREKREDGTKEI